MSEQEVSGGSGTAAGDGAVTAEWRRIQRERIDEEQAEAAADRDPAARHSRPRVVWAALLAALVAGVAAAVLANLAFGPRGRSIGEEVGGVRAPLGLLARPEAAPEHPLPDDGPVSDAETTPAADAGAADVEVFVPVPKTAVGPPPPINGSEP